MNTTLKRTYANCDMNEMYKKKAKLEEEIHQIENAIKLKHNIEESIAKLQTKLSNAMEFQNKAAEELLHQTSLVEKAQFDLAEEKKRLNAL